MRDSVEFLPGRFDLPYDPRVHFPTWALTALCLACGAGASGAPRTDPTPRGASTAPARASEPTLALAEAAAEDVAEPEEPSAPEGELGAVDLGSLDLGALGGGLVVTGATDARLLLFTFDDGPDPETTPLVLDALDAAGVRAVFFVVPGRLARGGARGEEEAELVREIARRGHFVGSHGLNHRHLHVLGREELETEVIGAEEALLSVLGERPWLFRPPGGARSEASDALLFERGYTQVLWNVITADFLTEEPDVVVRTFRRSLNGREAHGVPGGVVLLHDTHPWTAEALPEILAELERRNCELLSRGEPLYDTSPDPRWFVTRRGSGDLPGSEAPPATPPAEIREARQAALRAHAERACSI